MGGKVVGHRAAYRLRTHIVRIQGIRHRTHRHRVRHLRAAGQGVGRRHARRRPVHARQAARRARALADAQRHHAVRVRRHRVRLRIAVHSVGDAHRHRDARVGHQLVRAVAHHRRVADSLGGRPDRHQQDYCQNCNYFFHILWVLFVSFLMFPHCETQNFASLLRASCPSGAAQGTMFYITTPPFGHPLKEGELGSFVANCKLLTTNC